MSSRNLYQLEDGTYVRTQGEIPKGQTPNKVEVPIGSQELCDHLNGLILEERSKLLIDSHVEQVAYDTPFKAETAASLTTREQFEEAWDDFPLALRCHYAAMAMEDCRLILKQEALKNEDQTEEPESL